MNILMTSVVDLRTASHNRPHQLVSYLTTHHNVTVLCMNAWWLRDSAAIRDEYLERVCQRTPIVPFSEKRISPVLQEIASVKIIGKILESSNFDLHVNYNSLIAGYLAGRKAKLSRIPLVFDIADDLPAMIRISPQIPGFLRPFGCVAGNVLLKRNIGISSKVTFTLKLLQDQYNIPASKSRLIPNGVDTVLFRKHRSERLREDLCIDQDFIIGYVGVLREWVDLRCVFLAMKRLEHRGIHIKMLIVGGEGNIESSIKLAKEYGIWEKVEFVGAIPYSQVPEHIACMDVCLIPFKLGKVSENALPLKLFEYMACEKVVVSVRLPGVMEAVGNRAFYYSNAEELSNLLIELRKNEDLRHEMGLRGREYVKERYSWQRIGKNFENTLLEAASTM